MITTKNFISTIFSKTAKKTWATDILSIHLYFEFRLHFLMLDEKIFFPEKNSVSNVQVMPFNFKIIFFLQNSTEIKKKK